MTKRPLPLLSRLLISLTLLFAGSTFLACSTEPEALSPPQLSAPVVATAAVVVTDYRERIAASGSLRASLHTVIAAQVSGQVTQIVAEEGANVEAQRALLEIDPRHRKLELDRMRAGLAQASASLHKERRQAERMRSLDRSSIASKARLDEAELALQIAESNLSAQQAQLELAQRALEHATVKAPFQGVVGQRRVNLGEFVQPGTPLVEVVSLDPIELVFHLAEVDSARVEVGQSVEIRVAPYPNEVYHATVDVVYPTIDVRSRTQRVKATVANSDGRLRPGLFARVDLGVADRQGVILVPEESVLHRSDGAVVFVLRDAMRVERRSVELGDYHRGSVEVRSGLSAGDVVVVRGHTALADGALVRFERPGASAIAAATEASRTRVP